MSLGGETIRLVPFKNWSQLDVHKWTMRGKLPGTPAGLEVGPDYVNLTGEKVSIHDADACTKLEKLFCGWLKLELGTMNLARTPRAKPASVPDSGSEPQPLRFHVEVDKRGQVHVHCLQGKHTEATIGLTVAGFESLHHQGLMLKPRAIHVGALHDWVELDGVYCEFKPGHDGGAELERLLNERYVPATTLGQGKQIVVFPNDAASTGFDIQFQAMRCGVLDTHRHHLTDESLALLQDAEHCGLLHKRIVVKLNPPHLVFKQRTPDGGEQYLPKGPEYIVKIVEEGEADHSIDLSQPVNLLRVSALELTAIFNHAAINQYAVKESSQGQHPGSTEAPNSNLHTPPGGASAARRHTASSAGVSDGVRLSPGALSPTAASGHGHSQPGASAHAAEPGAIHADAGPARPNVWLKPLLIKPALRNDWFNSLLYRKMAERFGNSTEGRFGSSMCWSIALCAIEDVEDSAFKGIILTEKGSLGFLNYGHFVRFCHGVAFVGTPRATLEGIGVTLAAIGLDAEERLVFVVSDGFESKFGVPAQTLAHDLSILKKYGAVMLAVGGVLASTDPIETLWTVPTEQADRSNPQVVESSRPSSSLKG